MKKILITLFGALAINNAISMEKSMENKPQEEKNIIPGFEAIFLLMAIMVYLYYTKYKI